MVNQFLLVGGKFMPEMHVSQPGFTFSACGLFTKDRERIQNFKGTGDSRNIYQNKLDKAYFQLDTAYGQFKDLPRRTTQYYRIKDWILLKFKNIRDTKQVLFQLFKEVLIKSLLAWK